MSKNSMLPKVKIISAPDDDMHMMSSKLTRLGYAVRFAFSTTINKTQGQCMRQPRPDIYSAVQRDRLGEKSCVIAGALATHRMGCLKEVYREVFGVRAMHICGSFATVLLMTEN
jgi:hypothetical protein